MNYQEIERLFHLADELTFYVEGSEDEEILALKKEAENLYQKIDKLYVRELKRVS